jgi:hypothetical protein
MDRVPWSLRTPEGVHWDLRLSIRRTVHPRTRLHLLLDALARPCPTRPTHRDPRYLTARITKAEREGWLGEVEGLKISLAGAEDKLAQIRRRTHNQNTVELGISTLTSSR